MVNGGHTARCTSQVSSIKANRQGELTHAVGRIGKIYDHKTSCKALKDL